MPPHGDRPGDQALWTGVEQRGGLPLFLAGRSGHGQVHPGQDLPPGTVRPEPVLDSAARHTALERLAPRHDVVLAPRNTRELPAVISGKRWHAHNMSRGSDKSPQSYGSM